MHEQPATTRRELRDPTDPPLADTSPDAAPAVGAVPADPVAGVRRADDDPEAFPAAIAAAAIAPDDPVPPGAPRIAALQWFDPATGATTPAYAAAVSARPGDLLAGRRRRVLRPSTVVPALLLLVMIASYVAVTMLWPLTSVAPTVRAVSVQTASAPAAALPWPAQGSAAVAVQGMPGPVASGDTVTSIASITKVVTALLVLDRKPLSVGEQGPAFAFTAADRMAYWGYRSRGESSLDVPVGGTLTELQMLQGMLMGSANNYAQRLASDIWPTDAAFAAAAKDYLSQHGLTGITIVNPTGIEAGNTASAAALIPLAEKALENPVIARIVGTVQIELPGAGVVKNGNPLLADPGVVGVKTGTLDAWNLLTAKDITVGTATVRAYAAVLGQPGPDSRNQASRDLFARIEQELQPSPSLTAGTVVGKVESLWAPDVDVVTATDATVVLWNGAEAKTSTSFDLGDAREPGETVGSLTATGPVDADTVDVELAGELDPPSPWWRLTHPLDLFGLNE